MAERKERGVYAPESLAFSKLEITRGYVVRQFIAKETVERKLIRAHIAAPDSNRTRPGCDPSQDRTALEFFVLQIVCCLLLAVHAHARMCSLGETKLRGKHTRGSFVLDILDLAYVSQLCCTPFLPTWLHTLEAESKAGCAKTEYQSRASATRDERSPPEFHYQSLGKDQQNRA